MRPHHRATDQLTELTVSYPLITSYEPLRTPYPYLTSIPLAPFRYSNGQPLPPYSGDRSYPDLSKWIDEQSTLYARGQLLESNEEKEVVLSGFGRPNPEGKVLEVDEGGLDVLVGNGPVLVEFYAPRCAQ